MREIPAVNETASNPNFLRKKILERLISQWKENKPVCPLMVSLRLVFSK